MRIFARAIALAALLGTASAASAGVLFANNFDNETVALNSSLSNFTVTGQVDTIAGGTYGITCPGNCVDLDGTPGPGQILSDPIAFAAGKLIRISFDVSGNQRGDSADQFQFEATFGSMLTTYFQVLGGFTYGGTGPLTGTSTGTYFETIAADRPFVRYTLGLTPTTAGTLQLRFATPSADNIGPLLDNVVVTQVPEPASWALMIAGFGLIGAAARRRGFAAA